MRKPIWLESQIGDDGISRVVVRDTNVAALDVYKAYVDDDFNGADKIVVLAYRTGLPQSVITEAVLYGQTVVKR